MSFTIKQLALAAIVLAAALLAFFLLTRGDNSLPLRVQVTGTVTEVGAGTSGTYRVSGTGVANGRFGSVSLSGAGGGQPAGNCLNYSGGGLLVTAVGTLQLRPAAPSRACVTQATLDQDTGVGELDVKTTVEATGTAGSLLDRHGRLEARGTYNPDSGGFTVVLSGRLRR